MNPQNRQTHQWLPFVVEFVKFASAFAMIIAAALITLHVATAAM